MNPFLTAAGGSAGAQGPQGDAGAQGAQGSQGAQGAQGPAAASGSVDFMTLAADASFSLLLWADAGAVGGSTTVTRSLLATSRVLTIQPKLLANGATATGVRAQGALLSVSSGDFVHGFRMYVYNPGKLGDDATGDTFDAGAVFVEGAGASTASWYGLVCEWPGGSSWKAAPTIYEMSNTAGSNRWDAIGAYTSYGALFTQGTTYDIWLQRSGTTLTAFFAEIGCMPVRVKTWTVGTGAGMVGLRFHMWTEGSNNPYVIGMTAHTGSASASLPWSP